MRKYLLIILVFVVTVLQAQRLSVREIPVVDAADFTIYLSDNVGMYLLTGTETLSTDWAVVPTGTPASGSYKQFKYMGNITLNGHHVSILGTQIPDELATKQYMAYAFYIGGAWEVQVHPDFTETAFIPYSDMVLTGSIVNADVDAAAGIAWTKLSKAGSSIDDLADCTVGAYTSGHILIGDGSGYVNNAITGDITLSGTGVTAIATGVIVNADINAAAGIEFTKMEALTASMALASDAGGNIVASTITDTELGYLTGVTSAIQTQLDDKTDIALNEGYIYVGDNSNEATSLDVSGNARLIIGNGTTIASQPITGDITITNAGVTAIAAGAVVPSDLSANLTYELITAEHSFETNYIGIQKIYIPYKCELEYIYVCVRKAIEGSNDGTLNFQDNAANNMTGGSLVAGTLTIPAASAMGTVVATAVTGNNAFAAGEVLNITSAKGTAGGTVTISIKVTRVD
jgi:hypothetical protein